MARPRISIVTPSFNQAQFLEATIRSVVDQGYENLEYIVVDGGSTDGSNEIIKRYADRLAFWCSEPDGGHGNALNKGFAHATGEIMAWLNSDDLFFAWTLDAVAEIFESCPDVHWVTGLATVCDAQGRIVQFFRRYTNVYDFLMGRYEGIQQEGTFWRRSLWDAAGGSINGDYRFMVDGELWTRFFVHERLHHATCALGAFRQWGGNRSSANLESCHAEMRRAVNVMRQACDRQTLKSAAALGRILSVPRPLRAPAFRLACRVMPSLRWDTRYDLLEFGKDAWQVRRVPWLR